MLNKGWTVKQTDRLYRPVFLYRELVHWGLCTGSTVNGEPVVLCRSTVPLYCTIVLYRRSPVVLLAVRLLLAHNVRSQLYCCTAVLRVPLANKGDRTVDAAIVLFTGPLQVWSSYIRVPSAQNNRNIRLEVISEIMLYYRNVAVIFCCYAAVAADPADPVNNTCRKRPLAANHQSNTFWAG